MICLPSGVTGWNGFSGISVPAIAEQDDVLVAEDGVGELRNDGLVIARDAGKQRLARLQPLDEVFADLCLDRQHLVAGTAKLAESLGEISGLVHACSSLLSTVVLLKSVRV
jgi:hypothetical protein